MQLLETPRTVSDTGEFMTLSYQYMWNLVKVHRSAIPHTYRQCSTGAGAVVAILGKEMEGKDAAFFFASFDPQLFLKGRGQEPLLRSEAIPEA